MALREITQEEVENRFSSSWPADIIELTYPDDFWNDEDEDEEREDEDEDEERENLRWWAPPADYLQEPVPTPARSSFSDGDENTIMADPGILLLYPHQYFESRSPINATTVAGVLLPHQVFESRSPNNDVDEDLDDELSYSWSSDSYSDYLFRTDCLSEEIISQFLKSRTRRCGGGGCSREEDDPEEICVVCQCRYESEEMVAALECGHEYHETCIHTWLTLKNSCPICKREAIQRS